MPQQPYKMPQQPQQQPNAAAFALELLYDTAGNTTSSTIGTLPGYVAGSSSSAASTAGAIPPATPTLRFLVSNDALERPTGFRIGRASDCDLIISDPCISRQHAVLSKGANGSAVVQGVGRTELWVNGDALREARELRCDDVISFRRSSFPGVSDWLKFTWVTSGAVAQSPSLDPPPLPAGQFSDHFTLCTGAGSKLGAGGYADVHRCIERITGKPFAVKIVDKKKVAQDLSSRSELGQGSLLEEARILQSISHPNIVYIERVFDEDPAPNKGRLFIVQELINDGELFDKIINMGNFSETKARGAFRQLCHAIAYLHKRNIVHRDLKPENILIKAVSVHLDDEGRELTSAEVTALAANPDSATSTRIVKRYVVKVTDFGMARVLKPRAPGAAPSSSSSPSHASAHIVRTLDPRATVRWREGQWWAPPAVAPVAAQQQQPKMLRLKTLVGTDYYLAPEVDMLRFWRDSGEPRSSVAPLRKLLEIPHYPAFATGHPDCHADETYQLEVRQASSPSMRRSTSTTSSSRTRSVRAYFADASAAAEDVGEDLEPGRNGKRAAAGAGAAAAAAAERGRPSPTSTSSSRSASPSSCEICTLSEDAVESLGLEAEHGYGLPVDSFSLGVVLYTMLTGEQPFFAETDRPSICVQKLARWYNGGHPLLMECSSDARDLLHRLLDPCPRTRISVEGALEHTWLARRSSASSLASSSVPGRGRRRGHPAAPLRVDSVSGSGDGNDDEDEVDEDGIDVRAAHVDRDGPSKRRKW